VHDQHNFQTSTGFKSLTKEAEGADEKKYFDAATSTYNAHKLAVECWRYFFESYD